MGYTKSILDDLSDALAPVIREVKDIQNKLIGTRTKVIRIKQTDKDLFGDVSYEYQSSVINNVTIRYPFSSIELFAAKDTGKLDDTALDLFDLLPITMEIPFDDYYSNLQVLSGETSSPIELDENDVIIDILYDHHNSAIPLSMKVSRIFGGFFGRNQISKRYELFLIRGDMEDDIQDIIDAYVSGEATKYY